jgi:hypothetical protein
MIGCLNFKKLSMKNKVILTLSFLAGIILLNSCLKDDIGEYWKDDLAGKMYATVAVPTLQSMALKPVAGEVPFTFLVNIATDALPTEDITVSFVVDPASVTKYNTDFKKSYKAFPTIAMTTTSIVIKAGTRNGYASGKVWGAEVLNACDNFMAALSISSAKTASGKDITIAGNMKSYLLALPISNPYAADYRTVGYRIRPGNATEPVDAIQTFATSDCKTVRKNGFGNYGGYDVTIEITTNTVVVGGTTCYKVIATPIDPTTGASVGGMFTSWTGDASLAPADKTINYYNPAKKQFVLNCYYESSAGNRIMYEVNTRQ